MKGLVALVFVLGVGYAGIRVYEQSQQIVLVAPAEYAAAKTIEMPSQRDLFAELEMKLPPGLGTGSEVQVSDVQNSGLAPQVAPATGEETTVSKQITRRHRRHHRRSRHHRRRR